MRQRSKQSSVVAAVPTPPPALPHSLSGTPTPSGSSSSSNYSSSSRHNHNNGGMTMAMSNGHGHGNGRTQGQGHRAGPSSSSFSLSLPSRRRSLSDPFNRALQPPANESPAQRESRLILEQAAKAHSDDIDEQIKRERAALKRQKQAIKILLLGQSESGKSTTLKRALYFLSF